MNGRAVRSTPSAAAQAGSQEGPAPALPTTPLPTANAAAVAGSSGNENTSPPAPPRKQRKPPQDIGIPELLLGAGAEAADVIDHLPLREAGFTRDSLQAACDFLAKADPSECTC